MPQTIETTLEEAARRVDQFRRCIGEVGAEPRGVHISEVFFIYASVADHLPPQIIESGRARGQSTYLLARCFPRTPIVSIEYERDDADAPIALERLRPFSNVSCRFGDATVMMPEMTQPGDVAVIDGPKGFRSLTLAARLLRRNRPRFVFIHDCQRGTRIRSYIERSIPWAFFSDDPRFIQRYCWLDTYRRPQALDRWKHEFVPSPGESYGGTFACIQARPGFPTLYDMLRLRATRWVARMQRSVRKRLG